MSELNRLLGVNLKRARQERGMKLRDLGKAVGVSLAAVQQMEMGQYCSLNTLHRLAMALDKPMSFFFEPVPTCPTCGQVLPEKGEVTG